VIPVTSAIGGGLTGGVTMTGLLPVATRGLFTVVGGTRFSVKRGASFPGILMGSAYERPDDDGLGIKSCWLLSPAPGSAAGASRLLQHVDPYPHAPPLLRGTDNGGAAREVAEVWDPTT
jgi:hypothetical protein